MSSNRPPDRRRLDSAVESWPLRRRLIFEQIVLLAMVCVVVVAAAEIALHSFLIGQLDERLTESNDKAMIFLNGPGPGDPALGDAPGQATGTINALLSRGELRETSGSAGRLSTTDVATLTQLPADGEPRTRSLGDLGEFRLIARHGPPGEVLVTGLPMSEVDDVMISAGLVIGGVALVGLLAAAGIGTLIVRRALLPLQRVAATASRVAELPLDRGEVELAERVPRRFTDPRTEVGQVGLALNRLLGHVRNALTARYDSETRVRQFVADASHELRTPLAAVRGYAELIRRGDQPLTPEVSHALGRVESEAARMTTLVEDLLLLARLDSGRPLDYSTVDLSRLVVDAVSDVRVAGPDHHWRLALPPKPVTVPGDGARLHQVLANLLSNARTHTPADTTVRIGLSKTDGQVTLAVTDDGPGIPADLLPEVFERFARGDSSRSRTAGSTGLGLAIVAAVVQAHGGTVEVRSGPGRTSFAVSLPAQLAHSDSSGSAKAPAPT